MLSGYVLWVVSTSLCQILFGYWGDRAPRRGGMWLGTGVAIVAIAALGMAPSFAGALALLAVAGLGIAAFHPQAAAAAGACSPHHRTRAMAIFALGGYIGQAIGPYYAGFVLDRFDLDGLAWGFAWGLPALLVLWGLHARHLRAIPNNTSDDHPPAQRLSLASLWSGRRGPLVWLLAVSVLRVLPAAGVPLALAYWLPAQGASSSHVGLLQGAFMAGLGAGGPLCGLLFHRRHESTVFWAAPLVAAPVLAAIPYAEPAALFAFTALAGVLIGMTLPILTGLAQLLVPKGERMASAVAMGVSWGLAGPMAAGLTSWLQGSGRPNVLFASLAAAAAVSSLLCRWSPRECPNGSAASG